MARLEELTKGAVVCGVFGDRRLRIVDVTWHGSTAITLTYTDELTGRAGQAHPHQGHDRGIERRQPVR